MVSRRPAKPDDAKEADHGLALDALTSGFAELLSKGNDPYVQAADSSAPPNDASPRMAQSGSGPEINPRSILEAMLFVGHPQGDALTAAQVASQMRGVTPAEVDELVRDLNEQYERSACPYTIESHGPGYRLSLRAEFAGVHERLAGRVREARLSRAAVEVLALVAYNESLTGEEISRIRGRASGAILAQLVRRQLIKVERSADSPRVRRYSTTPRFLQLFGLESLTDLPRSQEIEQRL